MCAAVGLHLSLCLQDISEKLDTEEQQAVYILQRFRYPFASLAEPNYYKHYLPIIDDYLVRVWLSITMEWRAVLATYMALALIEAQILILSSIQYNTYASSGFPGISSSL
jgi:hypothetical protein